jgi:hypothetical protein
MWPRFRRERCELAPRSGTVHVYGEQHRRKIAARSRKMGYILQPRAGSVRALEATPTSLFSLPFT